MLFFFFLVLQNFYEYQDLKKTPQISTVLCCNNCHVLIEYDRDIYIALEPVDFIMYLYSMTCNSTMSR